MSDYPIVQDSISVIIPTFNRAWLVSRAVRSAIAATRPGDEIIVVDDGSTDDTLVVLGTFGEQIRVIAAGHNGAGAARNLGIQEARHDWIAFLDSDDEWDADKLELQRRLLAARPDVCFTFSDFRTVDRDGIKHPMFLRSWMADQRPWSDILGPAKQYSELAPLTSDRPDFCVHIGDLYPAQLVSFCVATFTLVFRRSACQPLPQFAEDVPTYEDHQFFGLLSRCGQGALLVCETATQHGHTSPRLTGTDELRSSEARLRITERVWGSDTVFLDGHANLYRDFVSDLRRRHQQLLVRKLASEGNFVDARVEASRAGRLPWKLALLLALPNPLARILLRLTRRRALGS